MDDTKMEGIFFSIKSFNNDNIGTQKDLFY